jgi:hypothetical protein
MLATLSPAENPGIPLDDKRVSHFWPESRETAAEPGLTAEQREAMIAEAAYFRAEKRGFAQGHEVEDWLTAEQEIDALVNAAV